MRKSEFCRRWLSVALTLFLCFSVAAPAPFNQTESSYLAPRGLTQSPEALAASVSRSSFFILAINKLFQNVKKVFQPLAKMGDQGVEKVTKETQMSRRTFNTLVVGTGATAALHLTGCDRLVINPKDSKGSVGTSGGGSNVTVLSGEPQILDIEKDFTKAIPTPLKDNATPDTTFTLLAQLRNIDAVNFTPNFFHVSAKTMSNQKVVLFPFVEENLSFAQTFSVNGLVTDAEGTHTLPQQLIVRAWLVEEPYNAAVDPAFSEEIDPTKFPPSRFRPIRQGENMIMILKGVYGMPEQTFFTYNSNERALPLIQEPTTLIRNAAGDPEPGVLDAVFQNPLQIANGNDGTLRIRFATGLSNTAVIQPEFVQMSIFHAETGKFLASFSERLLNPTGVNEFDILGSQLVLQTGVEGVGVAGDLIPNGTPLKIVAQNTDLGLTPADADPFISVEEMTLLRDANPVAMAVPVLGASGVEIVNGTRLLKLTIDPNFLPSDPLKPEFHYLRFKLSNNLEYTATVTIPSVVENGVSVSLAGAHEYYVEIPANLISTLPVTLQTVEVFNVRRGYQSVSTGEIPINGSITSSDSIVSTPAVSNVAVNQNLITFTVDPNSIGSDTRVSGHNLTFNLVNAAGEAITFSTFYGLPTRLALVGGVVTEVPENNIPHDLKIKIKDPSVLAFLAGLGVNETATLTTVTVNNGSQQVPSGPTVTVAPNLAGVTLPTVSVTELPLISNVTSDLAGLGDTVANIALQVNSNEATGGSAPTVLRFFFTLRKPNGDQFVVGKERPFEGVHQTDRTQTQIYSITLDDLEVIVGTVVESVTVISVDADLNESAVASFDTNLTLNPNKVSQSPAITILGNPGSVNAQIDFTIPTQTLDGTALTYPSGAPAVLMEAFTASGKYFTGFVQATDVQIVSPGVGRVFFDFSQFGNFTQTEEVFFVLSTAPPQSAFSARSAPQSGSYLVAALDSSLLRNAQRHWRRQAFSSEKSQQPKIAGVAGMIVLGFFSKQMIEENVKTFLGSVLAGNNLEMALTSTQVYQQILKNNVAASEVILEALKRKFLPYLNQATQTTVATHAAQVQAGPTNSILEISL